MLVLLYLLTEYSAVQSLPLAVSLWTHVRSSSSLSVAYVLVSTLLSGVTVLVYLCRQEDTSSLAATSTSMATCAPHTS